jgi:hypothetical membrane protein
LTVGPPVRQDNFQPKLSWRSPCRSKPNISRRYSGQASGALLLVSGAANLIRQPSAAIFNWTMIVAGLLIIVAAYYLCRALQNSPLRYFTLALGTAASVSLVLGIFFIDWAPVARLGEGGIERWIAYPVVLWMVGFGAWPAGRPAATTEPPQPGQTARLEPAEHHPAPV